ncbi:uncharacterized protein LOC143032729 isoform X2 [Oratosquilla oratoria]|uniref:uncharacterized protein LOC143032729 isoform X2 n=1 Tax=Oratosquilla oratoria TaxID=337810 RepID=UPI003F757949
MSGENSIATLVQQCLCKDANKRIQAYEVLVRTLDTDQKHDWTSPESCRLTKLLLANIRKDLTDKTSPEAMEALGCLVSITEFVKGMNEEQQEEALGHLLKGVHEVQDKKQLAVILRNLSLSRFSEKVLEVNTKEVLQVVMVPLTSDQSSPSIVYESINVLLGLIDIVPNEIAIHVKIWFREVFPKLFHEVQKIRAAAFLCIQRGKNLFSNENSVSAFDSKIIKDLIPDLKSKYNVQMKKIILADQADILEVWQLIIALLGKELHQGTPLINGLLEVVEKGFKSTKPEIRVEAFACWGALIDNFALDPNVLSNPKRLKLLIAPFKNNNARTEETARAKFKAWWHFIHKLRDKCSSNFELVVVPFLRFCFGSGSSPHANNAMASRMDRVLLMSGNASSPGRKYSGLHILCTEVLANLLSKGTNLVKPPTSTQAVIAPLDTPVISSSIFLKNYHLMLHCVFEAISRLNSKEDKQARLGAFIFQCLLHHYQSLDVTRKEMIEPIKEMFTMMATLQSHCQIGDSQSYFVYKFFEIVTVGNLALPRSIINSRQYHIASNKKLQDIMSGTLSNHIIHQLCQPIFIDVATEREGFFSIWEEILKNSNPASGKLRFLHSVVIELEGSVAHLSNAKAKVICRCWAAIASELIHHVVETRIIDEGDSNEHDWSCMYAVLLFPIKHAFVGLAEVEEHSLQHIAMLWCELWTKFVELTPLARTAEPNSEAEYVGLNFLHFLRDNAVGPPEMYAGSLGLLASVLHCIIINFRFGELGKSSTKQIQSPAKPKKKPGAMYNLTSCINVLGMLLTLVSRLLSPSRQQTAGKVCDSLVKIFDNVKLNKVIGPLIHIMVEPITAVLKVNPAARFGTSVEKKFIDMWTSYSHLINNHLGKKNSNEQLNQLAPLFKAALMSSNKAVKQTGKQMWLSTFATSRYKIPADLFEVLHVCELPPASIMDTSINTQDSSNEDPNENLPMGSFPDNSSVTKIMAQKKHFSGTVKAESPKFGTPVSREKSGGRKLSLEDMKDEDFVKIESPKVNRRVLTEHQVEVMKERRSDIPALYSDLSQQASQMTLPEGFTTLASDDSGNSMSHEKHLEKLSFERSLVNDENKDVSKVELPIKSTSEVGNKKVVMGKEKEKSLILLDDSMDMEGSLKVKENENGEVNAVAAKDPGANSQDGEGRKDECRRRKGSTPCKKTAEDVRRILKGTRKNSRTTLDLKVEEEKKVVQKHSKVLRNHRVVVGETCGSPSAVQDKKNQLSIHAPSKLADLGRKPEEEISGSEDEESQFNVSRSNTPRTYSRKKCVSISDEENKKDSKKYTCKNEDSHGQSFFDESSDMENNVTIPSDGSHSDLSVATVQDLTDSTIHELSGDEEIITNKKKRKQLFEICDDSNSMKYNTKLNSKEAFLAKKKLKDRAQNGFRSEERSVTPPKTTRSGRKIVAPNKDMPEPMTPPGKIPHKKRSKSTDSVDTELSSKDDSIEAEYLEDEEENVGTDEELESNEELSYLQGKRNVKKKISDSFGTKSVQSEVNELNSLGQGNRSALEVEMEVEVLPPTPEKNSHDGNEVSSKPFHDAVKQIESTERQNLTSETEINEEKDDNEVDNNDTTEINERNVNTDFVTVITEERTGIAESSEVSEDTVYEEDRGVEVPCTTSAEIVNMHEGPDDVENYTRKDVGDENSSENESRSTDEVLECEKIVTGKLCMESAKSTSNKEEAQNEENNCQVTSPGSKVYVKEKECDSVIEITSSESDCRGEEQESSVLHEDEDKKIVNIVGNKEGNKNEIEMTDEISIPNQENATQKTTIQVQKEDEKSPEKPGKSKFTSLVGTPEHEKRGMKLVGSRAAMLVACAKRNIKKRGTAEEVDSPSKDEGDKNVLRGSPSSKNSSPSNTPPNRKRKFTDIDGQDIRPWVRHRPSPGASPSASILKKRAQEEGEAGTTTGNETPSPPQSKRRRVSFADPPVSERVEIPPSPKFHMRAQKRLDMTKAAAIAVKSKQVSEEMDSQDQDTSPSIKCSQPICSSLVGCQEPIDLLASHLTSPSLVEGLIFLLQQRGITTVGKFCELTEADVVSLPVRTPKVPATQRALEKFRSENSERNLMDVDGTNLHKENVIQLSSGLDVPENENNATSSKMEVKENENLKGGNDTINIEDEPNQDIPVGLEKLLSKDTQDVINITEEIGVQETSNRERKVQVHESSKSEEGKKVTNVSEGCENENATHRSERLQAETATFSNSVQNKDKSIEDKSLSDEALSSLMPSHEAESRVNASGEICKCLDLLSNVSTNYELMMQMDHTARRHTVSNLLKVMDQVEFIGLYYEHLKQNANNT